VLVPVGDEPTLATIREREGARAATGDEFRDAFGDLPSEDEG
jgi:hypothetical protein